MKKIVLLSFVFVLMIFNLSCDVLTEVGSATTTYKYVNKSSYTVSVETGGGSFSISSGATRTKSGNIWANIITFEPTNKVSQTLSGGYSFIFSNK